MEIYLAFWDLLGADLVEVLNSCYRSGRLSPSQRSGVISLSFKKGDRLDPKNWRPISLLGFDYKIASRAIAGRLLKVIEHVVAPEQTCGVPGRYIGENAAFLRDVVTYATSSGTPVAILSHDQEKAFDRGDWSFLHGTLQHMGFGPSFTRWFNIFYTDVRSAVKANGHISQFFHLSRGVRQGCPPSPLLYVLYAEVLACTIRANPTIKLVQLPGTASALPVLSQYADDTSLYRRISPSGRRFLLILYSRVAPDRNSTRPNPKVSGLGPGAVGLTPGGARVVFGQTQVLGRLVGAGKLWGGELASTYFSRGKRLTVLASAPPLFERSVAYHRRLGLGTYLVRGLPYPHAKVGHVWAE